MDLDQKAMEIELARGTDEGLTNALRIYTEGAFSKSYSEINLSSPLPVDVPDAVVVLGRNAAGGEVRGKLAGPARAGDSIISVTMSAMFKNHQRNVTWGEPPSRNKRLQVTNRVLGLLLLLSHRSFVGQV